jgi:hypothetical protein
VKKNEFLHMRFCIRALTFSAVKHRECRKNEDRDEFVIKKEFHFQLFSPRSHLALTAFWNVFSFLYLALKISSKLFLRDFGHCEIATQANA